MTPGVVHQPDTTTLYVGYVLALLVTVTVLVWALREHGRAEHGLGFWAQLRRSVPVTLLGLAVVVLQVRPPTAPAVVEPQPAPARSRTRRRAPAVALIAAVALLLQLAALVILPLSAARAAQPSVVEVVTVPPVAGVVLSVGGTEVTTDAAGTGRLTTTAARGALADQVRLLSTRAAAVPEVAVRKATEKVDSRGRRVLGVGLDASVDVAVRVRTAAAGAAGAVRSVRLHALTGDAVDVTAGTVSTVRLLARRARLVHGSLQADAVTWSVSRVSATGGLVLRSAQPPLDPWTQRTWQVVLQPVQGKVVLETLPATPGVSFEVDGSTVTTDGQGRAVSPVADLNRVDARVRLASPQAGDRTVALVSAHRLRPPAARTRRVVAVLDVRRPVSLRFTDAAGRAVDGARVTEAVVHGAGETLHLDAQDLAAPVPLLTGRVVHEHGSYVVQPASYTALSVSLDGSNAVFSGRQGFAPRTSESWSLDLAVFDLRVTVRDVVFGHRLGTRAVLTLPDHSTRSVQVAASGSTHVPGLVRGQYSLLVGAAAAGGRSALLVSRDDAVDLRVVTWLDVAVLVAAGGLVAAGAAALGARWSRRGRATAP